MSTANAEFLAARDLLLRLREDYAGAYRAFQWPRPKHFNWALDWFDHFAQGNSAPALWIIDEDGGEFKASFAAMSERSNRLANFLRGHGVKRGDRVLLMMGNEPALWTAMLAAFKLGAVVIPATTLLSAEDLLDRIERGRVAHVIAAQAQCGKFDALLASRAGAREIGRFVSAATAAPGWIDLAGAQAQSPAEFIADQPTRSDDPLLLYFTSGTTARPKLVLHTHASYPIGHLSTMYWLGLRPGDIHFNISSPGWAKHAWSCFFAPWNAGACVFIYNQARFSATAALDAMARHAVNSLCAAPTVWRMMILEDLTAWRGKLALRELCAAGEPLNPEVIERVRAAWGLTIRDGFGQSETTALIGNSPGQPLKPGSMGRPMPGFRIELIDADALAGNEGQISVVLDDAPVGLLVSYEGDVGKTEQATRASRYRTGDVAMRDADGYLVYVGRDDDVFKSSGYRISPFEIESALIEHPAIAEAAVVPSPDPVRGLLPKAFVTLKPGQAADASTAASIFAHSRAQLAPYKRVRRIEFTELPKTISGKIRRVELRGLERRRRTDNESIPTEFSE